MNLEKAKPDPPLHFPDWPAALAATGWPPDQQAAVGATVRWYLSFCRRSRVAVCRQSARDFIAQVEQHKRPSPVQLERWKEAIRWFWRAARLPDQGVTAGDRRSGLREAESTLRTAEDPAAPRAASPSSEGWEARLRRLLRIRHYSYRTEQTGVPAGGLGAEVSAGRTGVGVAMAVAEPGVERGSAFRAEPSASRAGTGAASGGEAGGAQSASGQTGDPARAAQGVIIMHHLFNCLDYNVNSACPGAVDGTVFPALTA